MKVLHLFTYNFPYKGGEQYLQTEFNYLQKSFDKIVIYTHSDCKELAFELPENADVIHLDEELNLFSKPVAFVKSIFSKAFYSELFFTIKADEVKVNTYTLKVIFDYLRYAFSLKKFLKSNVVSKDDNVFYSYWLGKDALGLSLLDSRYKTIARAHGWDVYYERHPNNYLPFRKLMAEKLSSIYFISENGLEYTKSKLKSAGANFKLNRLGVINDLELSKKNESNKVNIVSCSSIIPLKRVELIAESLNELKGELNWTHIGGGDNLEYLKQQYPYFNFIGSLSNKEVYSYYESNQVDLFVNLSETEGLPVSMMEVMSFCVPVLATNVGGVSEIVKDEINGFLLSANPTKKDIVKKIEYFAELNFEKKNELRKAAYNTWEEKYNAEKNYTQFAEEIASL